MRCKNELFLGHCMKDSTNTYSSTMKVAGIDVAKDSLVTRSYCSSHAWRTRNHLTSIKRLAKRLLKERVELVVLECTGRHELTLVSELRASGLAVHLAHPKAVRNFAKALKQNAKSDPLDAEVLMVYGIKMNPAPTPETPPEVRELKDLVARREDLNLMLVQEKNRLKTQGLLPWNIRFIRKTIRFIERQLEELQSLTQSLVQSHPKMNERVDKITQEHGFGSVNATILLANVPELGTLNRNQVGALTGTAPFIRSSGKYCGEAKIQGGRTGARRALYTAAMTVVRKKEHPLRRFYYRLVLIKQKPKNEALTAVMRKLAIRINSILKLNHQKIVPC